MDSSNQHTADGTVAFLPHRLNRQPIVVRGLTADELWICTAMAGATGVALGIPAAWVTGSIAAAPTTIAISIAAGLFIGGGLLRRHKRGKPETWLNRKLQLAVIQHAPNLAGVTGGQDLIVRSGYWATRRGGA